MRDLDVVTVDQVDQDTHAHRISWHVKPVPFHKQARLSFMICPDWTAQERGNKGEHVPGKAYPYVHLANLLRRSSQCTKLMHISL